MSNDLTVQQLIDLAKKSNSAVSSIIFHGPPDCLPEDNNTPFMAVIVVRGMPETGEILNMIERKLEEWDK